MREAYGEIARLKEELERERDYLREEVQVSMNFGRIVGESPVLAAMLARKVRVRKVRVRQLGALGGSPPINRTRR